MVELCLLNFLEETAEVTDWYMLGLYMKLPSKDLSLIELFNVWMKRTPNASWELIAAALEKLGETVLAEKVRNLPGQSIAVRGSRINSHSDSSTGEKVVLEIEKSLVVFVFSTLEHFSSRSNHTSVYSTL